MCVCAGGGHISLLQQVAHHCRLAGFHRTRSIRSSVPASLLAPLTELINEWIQRRVARGPGPPSVQLVLSACRPAPSVAWHTHTHTVGGPFIYRAGGQRAELGIWRRLGELRFDALELRTKASRPPRPLGRQVRARWACRWECVSVEIRKRLSVFKPLRAPVSTHRCMPPPPTPL